MLTSHSVLNTVKRLIESAIIFSTCVPVASAQSTAVEQNHPQLQSQRLATQPPPESPPDINRPPRTVHRVGTAIGASRNSVSIKSTDAGAIPRQPAASGCINCGVINSVNRIGQDPGLNAIAGAVAAGTVAREIIRQNPYPHDTKYPGAVNGAH
ncbi:MAG: hypothetical protein LZF64_10655, partial [Nitrosomonas sp.]